MYLVAIAWFYVVLLMAVAEATSSTGSVLGAFFTFLLYGVLPVTILMYILGTPMRARARRRREAATESPADASVEPDGGSHAPGATVAPERKEA